MINVDSKSALSMIKFDMEIAKTQYFDREKRCGRLSCVQGDMKGVFPKVRCQILANFYGNKANTLQSRAVVNTIRPKDEKAICKLS